jgi:hypothetical protein
VGSTNNVSCQVRREGVNNKVRVIQRRSDGLRDEEYLCLKVLTCMLDPTCNQAEITHSEGRSPTF